MANMMGQVFTGLNQQNKTGVTPPPIPSAPAFFAVINGQQAGPYDINTLKHMAAQQQITINTLFWSAGMSDWETAAQSPELKSIFETTPPPIPGQ